MDLRFCFISCYRKFVQGGEKEKRERWKGRGKAGEGLCRGEKVKLGRPPLKLGPGDVKCAL